MLSHRNIRIGARAVAEYLELSEDDRLLSVLPYSFDAGLNQLTTMLLVGGTVVHQPVAMPSEVIRMAALHAVTGIAGVPPLWEPDRALSARRATPCPPCAASPIPAARSRPTSCPFARVFPGARIFLMYGLTEAFRSTYLPPERFAAKMGAIGRAIPYAQVFVVKRASARPGRANQGELVHTGPLVSMGYWERPELTAERSVPAPELAHPDR